MRIVLSSMGLTMRKQIIRVVCILCIILECPLTQHSDLASKRGHSLLWRSNFSEVRGLSASNLLGAINSVVAERNDVGGR